MVAKQMWSKPLLIVLGRGTPEERVLDSCKSNFWQGTSTPYGGHSDCQSSHLNVEDPNCGACKSMSGKGS